jgi:hypothetical protein
LIIKRKKSIFSLVVITLGIATMVMTGCFTPSKKDPVDLSKNKNLRENVYSQILNDTTLFNDFMNRMISNRQSMRWIMNNPAMMRYMFSNTNLQYMLQYQTGMYDYMIRNMMNIAAGDTTLTNQWNNMMIQHRNGMMMGR